MAEALPLKGEPPDRRTALTLTTLIGVAFLTFLPFVIYLTSTPYYLIVASRIIVYALAATSLDLILGYGEMVSFGHALYLTLGAYSVAIPSAYGITDVWIHLAIAIVSGCFVALLTGLVALRTRGVSFLMITLAFGQMIYFLFISLKQFGGDEGLNIKTGSRFGPVDIAGPYTLYAILACSLVALLLLKRRFAASVFGTVLRAAASNEARVEALGYPVFRYRLVACIIAGIVCSIAGVFLANITLFASPDYGTWDVSGTLMLMVALGGPGSTAGPVIGAAVLLLLEEVLKRFSAHWLGYFGVIVIALALFTTRGLAALFSSYSGHHS